MLIFGIILQTNTLIKSFCLLLLSLDFSLYFGGRVKSCKGDALPSELTTKVDKVILGESDPLQYSRFDTNDYPQ